MPTLAGGDRKIPGVESVIFRSAKDPASHESGGGLKRWRERGTKEERGRRETDRQTDKVLLRSPDWQRTLGWT